MNVTMSSPVRSVHVVLTGRVQGVGFRAWIRQMAEANDLSGWVRNRLTGEVEAVASGPSQAVESFIKSLKIGPDGAQVTDIKLNDGVSPSHGSFQILKTC